MPQLFPTQWIILVNMGFLLIYFIMTVFNFKLNFVKSHKVKMMNFKNWKW